MKKNIILSSVMMIFATLIISGCNDKEPYQSLQPNPRDDVYEGENLTVTIDGEPTTSIKSVNINSNKIPYAEAPGFEDNGVTGGGSGISVYDTSIIITGFPETSEDIALNTISTIYYFDGQFQLILDDLSSRYYEYSGAFTGDPYSPHSEQGLILEFTSIENP